MRIQIYAVRTSERGADIPEIYQRYIILRFGLLLCIYRWHTDQTRRNNTNNLSIREVFARLDKHGVRVNAAKCEGSN